MSHEQPDRETNLEAETKARFLELSRRKEAGEKIDEKEYQRLVDALNTFSREEWEDDVEPVDKPQS